MQIPKKRTTARYLRIKLYQCVKLVGNRTKPEICLTEIRFLWTTFLGMPCTPGHKSANISKPKSDIEKQTTARKTTEKLCQYVKFC